MTSEPTAAGTGPRPRLVVVASTYPTSPGDGTPSFVADLADVQADQFDTTLLVPAVHGSPSTEQGRLRVRRFRYFPRRYEDLADGAILENLRARRSRWLQVLPFLLAEVLVLRRMVRRMRPDLLHVHWLVPQGLAALFAARDVPWLLTCHGADVYALRDPLSRRIKRAVLRRASLVTTVNEDMRERLIDWGADPAKVHVLPMPAAEARVDPSSPAADAETPGVEGRIVFVGRLVEKKGVGVLLDALRRLPDGHSYTCEIVGDGPLRPALERQAEGLPGVRFLGQVDKQRVLRSVSAAEVVAVPSVPAASGDQDGLPVTLLEALARGRAVVASRLPGIVEAVEDERSALLVPPGDPDALAGALVRLRGDPDLRRRLRAGASARAADYTPASIGGRYNALLRSLLAARDGAAPGPAGYGRGVPSTEGG